MKSAALILAIAGLAAAICPQSGCQPCTSTLTLPRLPTNYLPVTTTYLQTLTSTSTVYCDGCAAVTTTTSYIGGHGLIRSPPTNTVTVQETVSPTYVCSVRPVPQVKKFMA